MAMEWTGHAQHAHARSPIVVKDPSKTLWVGNLPQGTQFRQLLDFAKEATPAKWAEVRGKIGAIGYPTAEDANAAMAIFKGCDFLGSTLEADSWTGKASTGAPNSSPFETPIRKPQFVKRRDDGSVGGWRSMPPIGGAVGWGQQQAVQGWWGQEFPQGGGKGNGKGGYKRRSRITPARTVWVGGLAEGTSYQDLLALAKTFGEARWAEVWKGTGAVGFSTEEGAAAAISLMNGQALGESTIQADKWGTK